mgnify:FL=1
MSLDGDVSRMVTLSLRVTANHSSAWRRVEFAGSPFFIHRHIVAEDGVVIYRAFTPTTTEGAHVSTHQHPDYGLLGQLGCERLPPTLPAKGNERLRQIEAFREPYRLLAQAVLTSGVPDLQGFRLHPAQAHIEIVLH